MAAIEFDRETIGHILSARKGGIRVPPNQRSYAWENEHIDDLFKDLNGAMNDDREEYFLGSIIVVKRDKGYEVFDGQQRLATTAILIAAIRDFFWYHDNKDKANTISQNSLMSKDRKSLEIEPHFSLSSSDNDFFINFVLRDPDDKHRKSTRSGFKKDKHQRIESHKKIAEASKTAYSFIESIVRQLDPDGQIKLLDKWLDFIDDGARVILVRVDDAATAFKVFETMNDRGLKLSAADLIKNFLCSLADNRQQEVITKWQSMVAILESLGSDDGDIVDFIRYYWIMLNGHTRSKLLFDKVKEKVNTKTKAVTFASELEANAHSYAAVLTSSHEFWSSYLPGMNRKVETLRSLRISQIRPLLLAAVEKFPKREIEKLFDTSISWSVRFLLTGIPSGTLEGYYSRNAKAITDGSIKTVKSLTAEMAAIVPPDEKFESAVARANVSNAQLARYYLRALQLCDDGNTEPQYTPSDGREVTLEHILPLKPGSGWDHFSAEEKKVNTRRLGNLALLSASINTTTGNVDFQLKRDALIKSEFSLTRLAGKYKEWSVDAINERQRKLAELAVKTWPLTK